MWRPLRHRSRRRLVVLSALGMLLLLPCIWVLWRYWVFHSEEAVIAALRAEGAEVSVEEKESALVNTEDMLVKTPRMFRAPRTTGVSFERREKPNFRLAGKLRRLESLAVSHATLNGDDVAAIAEMIQLKGLFMCGVHTPPDTWAHLGRLQNIERLLLSEVPLREADVADLSKLPSLRHLELDDCGVTDEGLARLAPLVRLEVLVVSKGRLTGAGVRALKNLPNLSYLDLKSCQLSDEAVENLADVPSLRRVDLSDNPITDKGLVTIARRTSISTLYLHRTRITDAGLQALEGGPTRLTVLGIDRTNVSEAAIARVHARTSVRVSMDR